MPDWKLKTPVAFIIFNRPDTTKRVFDAIRKAKPPKLFIIADGPRKDYPEDKEKCKAARKIAEKVDWDCKVMKNYSSKNLGCAKRVSSGMDWVFSKVEEAIILEDDCLPDKTFFRFCEELLEKYKGNEKIMLISGQNSQFGRKRGEFSYYFSRCFHCWGWATWKRAWKTFDFSMKKWPKFRDSKKLSRMFKRRNAVNWWNKIFERTYKGYDDSWAYRWTLELFIRKGLSIFPNTNLISNIGFCWNANHTKNIEDPHANMPFNAISFPLKHPTAVKRNVKADDFEEKRMFSTGFIERNKRRAGRILRNLISGKKGKELRIAWLIQPGSRMFSRIGGLVYWEHFLREFQKSFLHTRFYSVGKVHPYYKKRFNASSVGSCYRLILKNKKEGYKQGMSIVSPAIVAKLLSFNPKVVFSASFSLWTLFATLSKPIGKWKLIVLFEGSSPSVDYRNSALRTSKRKFIAKRANAFITNSKKGVDYLEKHLGIPKKKIFRVVHEIPEAKNFAAKKANMGKSPRFLFVGHLIQRKGVNYLLDAWSEFQKASGNGSLCIIGDGIEKKRLMQKARKLKLRDVYFAGRVDYNSISQFYNSSDVFVFPSLEETWGVAPLEAMAFGKPVICSIHAGAAELVEIGKNGFLFEPRKTKKLAELMLKFADSPELIIKFGKKSGNIMKNYTPANAVAGFSRVIKGVLK